MFKTKKTYGIVAVMLAISLLLCSGCAVIDKSLGIEPKETWHATVDEHFVDNKVDVVMQKYASKKTYTPKDFKEVGCVEIKIRTTEEQINDGMKLAISVILDKHSKENVLEACQKLIKRRDVFSATPQYYAQTDLIPDDLGYSQFQSAMPHISLPDAWDITTGSSSIIVGVVDTGIDNTHLELVGRVNVNLSRGFDSAGLTDTDGHGTAIASVIGANWSSNSILAGVCQNVTLVSLKVGDDGNDLDYERIIDAINYADEVGIDILNMSLSIKGLTSSKVEELKNAIANFDGLVVCSAGNNNENINNVDIYPAKIIADNLITVGSSTLNDTRYYSDATHASNYGSNYVHLFAPGESITVAYPSLICQTGVHDDGHMAEGYHSLTGTSLAAPYVSGVAALIMAAHPSITAAQLKTSILDSVDVCANLQNYCTTGGRLNAYNAVRALAHYNYTDNGNTHSGVCSCGQTITRVAHVYEQTGTIARCKYCSHTIQLQNVEPEQEIE